MGVIAEFAEDSTCSGLRGLSLRIYPDTVEIPRGAHKQLILRWGDRGVDRCTQNIFRQLSKFPLCGSYYGLARLVREEDLVPHRDY
jgi:hypothetical protein